MKTEPTSLHTIERPTLARMAFCNSPKMPQVVDDHGQRRRWVGIGWITEGPADGTEEARVIERPTTPTP